MNIELASFSVYSQFIGYMLSCFIFDNAFSINFIYIYIYALQHKSWNEDLFLLGYLFLSYLIWIEFDCVHVACN